MAIIPIRKTGKMDLAVVLMTSDVFILMHKRLGMIIVNIEF